MAMKNSFHGQGGLQLASKFTSFRRGAAEAGARCIHSRYALSKLEGTLENGDYETFYEGVVTFLGRTGGGPYWALVINDEAFRTENAEIFLRNVKQTVGQIDTNYVARDFDKFVISTVAAFLQVRREATVLHLTASLSCMHPIEWHNVVAC